MKKFYLLFGGIMLSCAPMTGYAGGNCTDWGEADVLAGHNTSAIQALINSCTELHVIDPSLADTDPNCATFDEKTFITRYNNGTCIRLGWCETCPSGYHLVDDSGRLKIGDYCYATDDMMWSWEAAENTYIDQYICVPDTCTSGEYMLSGECKPCPDMANAESSEPRTAITDCYIPKNRSITDSTGTYIYTEDCHYTE